MKSLIIEKTEKTPYIHLNALSGQMEFSGRSRPESSIKFYEPIEDWLLEYIKNPAKRTIVNFRFDYFDTSSSKWFLTLIKHFETIYINKNDVVINWFYDDDDILEYGEEIQDIREVPINLIEVD
jgi:hypothetical protein